ncbi:MAG: ABC transporter permease [Planctomycetota bacterium]|nr:ABC transporter permease [Planctomycetota bacterium]
MTTEALTKDGVIGALGGTSLSAIDNIGNLGVFSIRSLRWLFSRWPRASVLLPTFYQIGVQSLVVVLITGGFIGMVLAVQTYAQFRSFHLESRLGAVITMTLVSELGPVLAATMLAGRVGSSMAAELGTMRVTEQIDALRALGANPLRYLVVPRFLACFLLIPILTVFADAIGILGGWLFCTQSLGLDSYDYWHHALNYVGPYDIFTGFTKSIFFGGAIALISCHRGFHCGAGAEGVGRAATEAFVWSFVVILILDFFLGVFFANLYFVLWPNAVLSM